MPEGNQLDDQSMRQSAFILSLSHASQTNRQHSPHEIIVSVCGSLNSNSPTIKLGYVSIPRDQLGYGEDL